MAFPTKDSTLVSFSTNWNTLTTATPTVFGLTSAQATAYTALHNPYIAAYNAATAIGARSKSLVTAKNTAKAALLAYGRQLYGFVQASITVTDANKNLLGVTVRAMPQPQPAPAFAPALDIVQTNGRTVRIRLHDSAGEGKRSKPAGVKGAAIFSFVGATPPTDLSAFDYEGNTTRTIMDVVFPDSVAPGSKVWIIAMWFNERAQNGPACDPVGAFVQFGGMSMAV